MKTSARTLLAEVMGIALLTFTISCASTGAPSKGAAAAPQTEGFLNGYYKNLQPGPEGGAKMRWLKPGVDFGTQGRAFLVRVGRELSRLLAFDAIRLEGLLRRIKP